MRKILCFILIMCSIAGLSQNTSPPGIPPYSFMDEHELIIPDVDYSRVYIVFQANLPEKDILEVINLYSKLTPTASTHLPWPGHRVYTLQKSVSDTPGEAEILLNKIRKEEAVLSVYPAFVHNDEQAFVDNTILVNMPSADASLDAIRNLIIPFDGIMLEEVDLIKTRTFVISIPSERNLFEVSRELYSRENVIYAHPNFQFTAYHDFIPDDPKFIDQWYLEQESDADINAPEAWDITHGSSSIAVAVIDGHGYDLDHAEMVGKYISPFNAVDSSNNPAASDSLENHGTPCAGLIGALTNNAIGVASVGYNTMVVPIKIGFDFGIGDDFQTTDLIMIRACAHVMSSQQDIVAVSNSYTLSSWANIPAIRDAFASMRTETRNGLGCVVLASTGNENLFNSVGFPFQFPHVVGVGATNRFDTRASFSNYGDSIDLVAPGTYIWTIDRTGSPGYSLYDYYEFGNTSASCPIASAVVALIASMNPAYTWLELQNRLCRTCDKIGAYIYENNPDYKYDTWNQQAGYGRVNAFIAVKGFTGLDAPQNLTTVVTGSDVLLNWESPGKTQKDLINTKHIESSPGKQELQGKGLLGYKIYRNGVLVYTTLDTSTYYTDLSLDTGTYQYLVSSMYSEGESNPTGPAEASISGTYLEPPHNLQYSLNGNNVNLNWLAPEDISEVWLYYHDNSFENSFASIDGGSGTAQLFTLSSPPVTLHKIRFYTSNIQEWDQPMSIYVLTGDGNTVLGGPYHTTGANDDWISISTSVEIYSSTFMIATYNDDPDGPYVGVDDSYFDATLFFGNHISGFTELSQLVGHEYVGSHEALIEYASKQDLVQEWIRPANGSEALRGYNIYRDGTKINSYTWILTSFTDKDVTNGTYNYSVTAVFDEGQSGQAGPVQINVSASGLPVPENLYGYISDDNKIELNWSAPEENNLIGYNLFRNNLQVNSELVTTTSAADSVPGWGTYIYNVTAVYDEGESAFSNSDTVEYYLGIEESYMLKAKVYPNPAEHFFRVETEENIQSLSLYSLDGRIIHLVINQGRKAFVNVSDFLPGIYLLKIEAENSRGFYKVIIR